MTSTGFVACIRDAFQRRGISARRAGKAFMTAAGIAFTAAITACASTANTTPATPAFSDWPAGASPEQVGKRVAENFLARPFDFETNSRREFVIYPEVCAWYGALTTAQLSKNADLQQQLIRKFDPLLGEKSNRISPAAHVDYRVFGTVPLEIYIQTKQSKFLNLGRNLADKQWENPTEDGITAEARYWVDDIYMIAAVQTQAYRATGDKKYLDRAALTTVTYLEKLQQTNGLFFHAADSPFYWGRGNGWYAAGMAELLRSLPENHPKRAQIMASYKKMMAALLRYQGSDGLWRQLIDNPESWSETSGSGMFAFAMVTGVRNGWLDANTYGPAARKAWLGLVKCLDDNANISNVCEGTNKAFREVGADPSAQLKFYLERQRKTGDLHGQAALLWTASALLR